MIAKVVLVGLLLVVASSRNYQISYKQCDSQWRSQKLGFTSLTLCSHGCLVSSVAMALSAIGKSFNPGTLNSWLKDNNGYDLNGNFRWWSVYRLGLKYAGKIRKYRIAVNLKVGNVVMLKVRSGHHWVLAKSMSGNTIYVNDPGYWNTSYRLSDV